MSSSSKHHRRRSPSPSSSDDYSDRDRRRGNGSGRRSGKSCEPSGSSKSHRSDKPSRKDGAPRGQFEGYDINSATHPASAVPPNMRPAPSRSYSDDTVRRDRERSHKSGRDRDRDRDRERDRGDRYGSDRSDSRDRDRDRDRDRGGDSRRDRDRGDDRRERTRDRGRRFSYSDDDDRYDRRRDNPREPERHRASRRRDYESDNEYSRSRSRERAPGGGHPGKQSTLGSMKPIVEDVLAAFGLVSAKHSQQYDDTSRGHGHSSSSGSHRGPPPSYRDSHGDRAHGGGSGGSSQQSKALKAAITAAAAEAFRQRKQPGGFTPERILKIASAAIAAGGLDAIMAARGPGQGSTRQMIESVLGKGQALLGGGSGRGSREGSQNRRSGTGLSGLIRSLTVNERDRR